MYKGSPDRLRWLVGDGEVVVAVVKAKRQDLRCSRRAPGYFTLIGDKTPPATCESSEVARA